MWRGDTNAKMTTEPKARGLDAGLAQKILDTDLKVRTNSAVEKLKSGKPLSISERRLLAVSANGPSQTYFDSMASAAKGLDVPLALLKKAKRMGAPGFRASRVYADELLPWLRDHADEAGSDKKERLEIRRLKASCERMEFALAVERGEFVPVPSVAELFAGVGTAQLALLRQKLENEYPVACAGQEAAVIRVYGKRLVDDICVRMQKLISEWNTKSKAA